MTLTRRPGKLAGMHPVLAERLYNQFLARPAASAVDVVTAMAAMQSQDFGAGMWAIGARTRGLRAVDLERLLDRGEIIRTHPMRGTHHFLARGDVRWMLAVLAPTALAKTTTRYGRLELDATTLDKAMTVLHRELEGGRTLVRSEVGAALRRARISPEGQRLPHIIMHAELLGLVCSGPRRGKEITIALLDDRVPRSRALSRDAALAELARRYFTTRGPATLRDFMWWCGLRAADVYAAVEHARLDHETIDGVTYYRGATGKRTPPANAYLLPQFDEYTVAYNRRELIGVAPRNVKGASEQWLLAPNVVIDGRVVGTWKRSVRGKAIVVEVTPWRRFTASERAAIERAAQAYADFVGLALTLRT